MATKTAKKVTFFVLPQDTGDEADDELLELTEAEVAKRTDLCEFFADKESAETRLRERVVARTKRKHRQARMKAKVKREREDYLEKRPDMIPRLIAAKKMTDANALARDPTTAKHEIAVRAQTEPDVLSAPFDEAMELAREIADENEERKKNAKRGRKAGTRKKRVSKKK